MKVVDFLKEGRIELNLEAFSKKDAIRKVALLIEDDKAVLDFETLFKDILEREELKTTGIGDQIAIPHARTDAVKHLVIAIGIFPRGVEFEALDGKLVNLVFLMGTPKEKNLNNYLQLLANLNRLLQKKSFRESLLDAKSSREIIEKFKEVEG